MAAWHAPRIRAASGDSIASPAIEAKGLYTLLKNREGFETESTIRTLIVVSESDRAELSKSREQWQVREIVTYREKVLECFEKLLAADMPVEVPVVPILAPRRKPRRVASAARQNRGNGRPRKVNERDAERIREIIAAGDMTLLETARRFCVSIGTISRVAKP